MTKIILVTFHRPVLFVGKAFIFLLGVSLGQEQRKMLTNLRRKPEYR